MNKIEFRAWNEEMLTKYDPGDYHKSANILVNNIIIKPLLKIIGKIFFKELSKQNYCNKINYILEVGSGSGNVLDFVQRMLMRLKEREFKFLGIDLSFKLLKKSVSKDAQLINATACEIPFKDNSFNFIYCTEVIEHVPNPNELLEEVRRVLSANGIFVITTTNENFLNILKRIIKFFHLKKLLFKKDYNMPDNMLDEWHLTEYDIKNFIKLLKTHFKIVDVKIIPSKLFPIHIVVKCKKI